jgi:hypothetical protein
MIAERTERGLRSDARGCRHCLGVALRIDAIQQVVHDLSKRLDFRHAQFSVDALIQRIAHRDVMELLRHASQCELLPTLQQI